MSIKECCSSSFRKIGLLFWKNLILRRRHFIITAFEIILPVLCVLGLFGLQHLIESPRFNPNRINYDDAIKFPIFTEQDMMESTVNELKRGCPGYDENKHSCILAYSPNTVLAERVMEDVGEYLKINTTTEPYLQFQHFETEEEILNYVHMTRFNDTLRLCYFGVVFSTRFDNVGPKISYKILRFQKYAYDGIHSSKLFSESKHPSKSGRSWSGQQRQNAYIEYGVAGLQIAIDKTLISRIPNPSPSKSVDSVEINLQEFPYPRYQRLRSYKIFRAAQPLSVPITFVIGFLFTSPSILRNIISEKNSGIKELMKIMGVPNWIHWTAWMLDSAAISAITITIIVILLFADYGLLIAFSDPTLFWVVLFLYLMPAVAFCFLLSTFFKKASLAIVAGMVLWIVTFFAVAFPIEENYDEQALSTKLLLALLPNANLYMAMRTFGNFEELGVGATWSNFIDRESPAPNGLSIGLVCLMFIVDIILYMTLALYFENIIPSEFGVRKPCYYIFLPSTWCTGKAIQIARVAPADQTMESQKEGGFEAEEEGLEPGVVIQGLTKKFSGGKIAVDNISIKFYRGEITTLLGHNGAGKTTTISMLTGITSPTSGKAIVNGYDINTSMNQVRDSLGLCPQQNMLFDDLTVEEHLMFFAKLKGMTSSQAKGEVNSLLAKLHLIDRVNAKTKALSGGQKRKLNLGMAMAGGTKVLILDEPTSGMDPEARRAIWDLLLGMREQRTIILTTHYMEEADILGDRIAIMASGKVKCHGTSLFLKKFYGAGYTLKVTTTVPTASDRILSTAQKVLTKSYFKDQNSEQRKANPANTIEVTIVLPNDSESTKLFPEMFSELESMKQQLGIQTIGLSLTTMDEVFVKVGELEELDSRNQTQSKSKSTMKEQGSLETPTQVPRKVTGLGLLCQQIWGLLIKRFLYSLRKWSLIISQFVVPLLIMIGIVAICNSVVGKKGQDSPSLRINMELYNGPTAPYTGEKNSSKFVEKYVEVVKEAGGHPQEIEKPIENALLRIGEEDFLAYHNEYLVGAAFTQTQAIALHSTYALHSEPLSINLISNALCKTKNEACSIEVTIHPINDNEKDPTEYGSRHAKTSWSMTILGIMPIALLVFAANFVVFPVEERATKAKQLQLMTGLQPVVYWSTYFAWDILMTTFLGCLSVSIFYAFDKCGAFTSGGGAGAMFLLIFAYGFCAIPYSYFFSLFMRNVPRAIATTVGIQYAIMNFIVWPVIVTERMGYSLYAFPVSLVARLFPVYGIMHAAFPYGQTAANKSYCNLRGERLQYYCESDDYKNPSHDLYDYSEIELRRCCDCRKHKNITYCATESFYKWSEPVDNPKEPTPYPGFLQDVVFLFIYGLIYIVIIILIEHGIIRRIYERCTGKQKGAFQLQTSDEDVLEEIQRIQELVTQGRIEEEAFVVMNLCKNYGTFAAVSNLNFGVHHGECFGLLGVNGAGKTTSFSILTGDIPSSYGTAYLKKYSLENNRTEFLRNIGYCPQFDPIIAVLTGREMLRLFCRLRGVPVKEADKWLDKLGLTESRNVQCGNYSGGMKRRLSAGLALIGDPPLILFDEPTSGVDPIARRKFWEIINSVTALGQAVILTSHSMEECEALCSRLGIMVNGQFQCFGRVQHLKKKFAQGYSITLKLKSSITIDSPELTSIRDEMARIFYPCFIKDEHQNILLYQVLNTSLNWSGIFKNMEDLKEKFKDFIEDYSVNDTTLEEVFLSFARQQYGARTANVSLFQRITG